MDTTPFTRYDAASTLQAHLRYKAREMSHTPPATQAAVADETSLPWYRLLNGYHWFVLVVCTLGWLFDCLDQQLFNLARKPALAELLNRTPTDPTVDYFGAWATSILLIGWATGGILFGIMGDRLGRVKTMVFTILSYSLFTGLSGFAFTPWDFLAYRFLAGLGVGGQFAVGVTLVAESLPDRARPHALGMLQAFSAAGNVGAALISMGLFHLAKEGVIGSAWRWMFAVGVVPSVLAVVVMSKLREPEAWKKAVSQRGGAKKAGSLAEMFGDPRWRHRAIVGLLLASAGVVGLWGIGVFSNDLTQSIFRKKYEQAEREKGEAEKDRQFVAQVVLAPADLAKVKDRIQGRQLLGTETIQDGKSVIRKDATAIYTAAIELLDAGKHVSPEAVLNALDRATADRKIQTTEDRARRAAALADVASPTPLDGHIERITERQKMIDGNVGYWASITLMMFNVGAFFGIYAFSFVTARIGRRPTFALSLLAAMGATIFAFLFMSKPSDLFWMVPLMGACQLSLFGGYAIYFPELFPTRLRSTGTSFCYNIARFAAASGPVGLGWLTKNVFASQAEPMRYAGVAMCSCFLVGLAALLFAPETKGQPLPE